MARIRSKNTMPERFFRSALHRCGARFRVNKAGVPGNPDIYFSKKKVAIFVHGCYWHRHKGCKFAYIPKSNEKFWAKKHKANVKRDRTVLKLLRNEGVRVLTVWECTVKRMIKNSDFFDAVLQDAMAFLSSDEQVKIL